MTKPKRDIILEKLPLILLLSLLLFMVVIPFTFLFFLNNGLPWMNAWIDYEVTNYLEEQGYQQEDILKSHVTLPKMRINKNFYHTHYMVVFKDEPDITYFYGKKKWFGDIVQFREKKTIYGGSTHFIDKKTLHSEDSTVLMLENK